MKPFNRIIDNKYYLFAFFAILSFFYYGFVNYIYYQPQGFHFSRQTDTLAFIYNYLQNGFNFFSPANYNLESTDGKAVSEFSVFHYLYAIIIKLFHTDYTIVRILNLTLIYFSLFYLFAGIELIVENHLLSTILTFLFFSSTVLLHYSVNFLPDAQCIAICFIANYHVLHYLKFQKFKHFINASILHTFLAILKPSYFIYLLAFQIVVFIKQRNLKVIIYFAASAAITLGWILFIRNYNLINHNYYYLTTIKPLWNYTHEQKRIVFDFILNYWYSKYYYQSTFHLFLIILIALPFLLIKNRNSSFSLYTILTLGGMVTYFLLFFYQFKDHDYYFITLIPGIVIIMTITLRYLIQFFNKEIFRRLIVASVLIITLLSTHYAKEKLADRYQKSFISGSLIGFQLRGMDAYLDTLNIDQNSKIILIGDSTPNGGLFMLKRKGWSIENISDLENKNRFAKWLPFADNIIIANHLHVKKSSLDSLFQNDFYKQIGSFKGNIVLTHHSLSN